MFSQLIQGVAPLALDNDIAAFLKKKRANPYPGASRWIGILNDAGNLYRVIVADMPSDASGVADFLSGLGLVDRIGYDEMTFAEIDTVTRRPIRTAWTCLFQAGREPYAIPDVPRLKR